MEIFRKTILFKYNVGYHRCNNCFFIQTDEPFWLDEAYNNAINDTDIGLVARNKNFSESITTLLRLSNFNRTEKYLDYGAGYGMFVRMMRDNGFNFYWADKYCENIYATKFSAFDLPAFEQKYTVVTAFELFEHLSDPVKELEDLLKLSDSILFSTELVRNYYLDYNWWYFSPEHGQHIAFYDIKTLEYLAKKYDLNLYTNNKTLHLLTKRKLNKFIFKRASSYRLSKIFNGLFLPASLLNSDHELYMRSKINKSLT